MPVVLGTAGHIDHGKSTLVRALTGIDPDRLKEEKERGLTIDLGFANFALPDGRRVGIVDVPGHERFIRNMAAGASGIDLVVLVVAADDGVMPQTREHLQIMQLLGVERGLVALTKVDAVDPELVELAAEDVRDFVRGTFLEKSPMLHVSALSGQGMDELRSELVRMASETVPRPEGGIFRMPIQRVFSKRGFGTVLTGIPVSGAVTPGDAVEVLPGGGRGKVRGIQAYGGPAERARAGHSAALNVTDVEHHAVGRGAVVAAPGFFRPARMVGARLTALPGLERALENRIPIRLHTGTADPPGEVVLLDAQELEPGASCLVQFRLEEPVVVAPGDRFVLRLLSPAVTLGGGVILEESRHRLKRFKGFVLEELTRQESSVDSPRALLESALLRLGPEPRGEEELAVEIKRPRAEATRLLEELAAEDRVRRIGRGGKSSGWVHAERLEGALEQIDAALARWFGEHPHRRAMDVLELRRLTGWPAAFLGALLEEAQERGRLALEAGGQVRAAGREVELAEADRAVADQLLVLLAESPFSPPAPAELAERLGPRVPELLEFLTDEGRTRRVSPELYLAAEAVERARAAIVDNCERNGHLEIPELRDVLGTTRKYLIPLLEHFDAQGLTLRQGGHRVLKRR